MPETEKGRKGSQEARVIWVIKRDSGFGLLFSKPEEVIPSNSKDTVCFGIKTRKGLFAKLFKISLRVLSTFVLSK